jgi:hypothetical protein
MFECVNDYKITWKPLNHMSRLVFLNVLEYDFTPYHCFTRNPKKDKVINWEQMITKPTASK